MVNGNKQDTLPILARAESNSLCFCLHSNPVSYCCGPFSSQHCNVRSSWSTVLNFGVCYELTTLSYPMKTCSGVTANLNAVSQVRRLATYLVSSCCQVYHTKLQNAYGLLHHHSITQRHQETSGLTTIVACCSSWTTCWFPIYVSYLVQRVHSSFFSVHG